MLVSDLTAAGPSARNPLRRYSKAVRREGDTVEVFRIQDVARAIGWGEALVVLETSPGGRTIKRIVKQEESGLHQLDDLIAHGDVAPFSTYCATARPLLHADNGKEIESYQAMRHSDGVDPSTYVGRLRHVRNYHRFEGGGLDALIRNEGDTSRAKPLVLVLHSAFDHNGAFHRDPNMTAVFSQSTNNTLMLEGATSLAAVSADVSALAATYGQPGPDGRGKVRQVMIAGHGSSRSIELAGDLDRRGDPTTSGTIDLDRNRRRSEAFLRGLLGDMADTPDGRIVFNACLTASNEVNQSLSRDPRRARRQILGAIRNNPSLVTATQQMLDRRGMTGVRAVGAHGSFGQVRLIDPATGRLDVIAGAGDPELTTSDKLRYVRFGRELEGALRAVVEMWAQDRTACVDKVNERLHDEPDSTTWQERLIRTFYGFLQANPSQINLMNQFAAASRGLAEGNDPETCRYWAFSGIPRPHRNAVFTRIAGTTDYAGTPVVKLVVDMVWMATDASKTAAFLADLAAFTSASANDFVPVALLGSYLPALLPSRAPGSAPTGEMVLALLGAVQSARPEANSRRYLRQLAVGSPPRFSPAPDVDALLGGLSDEHSVLAAIGKGPAATPAGSTPSTPNLALVGGGNIYVEPMTNRALVVPAFADVYARPSVRSVVLGLVSRGLTVDVIGRTSLFYAVEHAGASGFVRKRQLRRLAPL